MLADAALNRFVEAQDPIYAEVCAELAAGHKRSHWMWFIFPQLQGLGRSAMALHYGLASPAETIAFWRHPVLRHRLTECTQLVLAVQNKSVFEIFGKPDDMKFRSCMTLFDCCVAGEPLFAQALSRYCDGKRDERTLALLG